MDPRSMSNGMRLDNMKAMYSRFTDTCGDFVIRLKKVARVKLHRSIMRCIKKL